VLPGVAAQVGRERNQLVEELLALHGAKTGGDAHVQKQTVFVHAEEERGDAAGVEERPEAAHHALHRLHGLHLDPAAPPGLVGLVAALRHHPVDAFSLPQPPARDLWIGGDGRERHGRAQLQPLEGGAPLREGSIRLVEQIEDDVARRRRPPQLFHSRPGRMNAIEQRGEIGAAFGRDEELAVEGVSRRLERLHDLGEVSAERACVAAAQIGAEGEAAKAVPLRLVEEIAERQLALELRQHGLHALNVGANRALRTPPAALP